MQNTIPPLNIGLIVDSGIVSKYVYDLAQWGQRQSNLRISSLIIQNKKQIPSQRKLMKTIRILREGRLFNILEQIGFSLIVKKEDALLRRNQTFAEHVREYDLKDLHLQSVIVEPEISKSGFVYRYSEKDIARIKSLNLDVLIRCGAGILRGEILNSTEFGILSFHHGDNRINRGGPAGFWEVYFQQDTTGFIIQRLTEELDNGEVLIRGQFPTQPRYRFNQALLFKKSYFYLKKLLSEVADSRILPRVMESQPYFNRLFRTPTLSEQCIYVCKLLLKKVRGIFTTRILRKDIRWGVAFSRGGWKNLVMWRSNIITNPPNHFLADPFVVEEDGRDFCFLEDYDYDRKKACIVAYELKDKAAVRLGEAIVEPFHVSFPYLFRFDGKLYMCPETGESKEIRLYECVSFPLHWKLSRILMENVSAADTMIFEKDGLWWLFTNIDPSESDDRCSELFIFFSENPLSDQWTPHRNNPVLVDVSKARNAGLLFDESSIYRVAQKQGFDVYGKGFSINKISTLNPFEYLENELCSVEANFFPNLLGTHHLHSNGRVTMFDFVQVTSITD